MTGGKNSACSKRQASDSGTLQDISRVKPESSDLSNHPHQRVSSQNMIDLSFINGASGRSNNQLAESVILNVSRQD